MNTLASESNREPLSQPALEEIVSALSADKRLVYLLYARDDVADSAIDAFGPDATNASQLVAALSQAGPEPHRFDGDRAALRDEEAAVLAHIQRLQASGADFILAWRSLPEHDVRIAYSPDRPWHEVRAELSDLVLSHHPLA